MISEPVLAADPIRVLLVDDQELVRSGLRKILRRRDGFEIVGECDDGDAVNDTVVATAPDVVVMDLRMRVVDGIESIRRLRELPKRPRVLVLTTFTDDRLCAAALRAGASGFVLKDSSAEELIRAVHSVAVHGGCLDPAMTETVLRDYRLSTITTQMDPTVTGVLTARELDVLTQLGRGHSNSEIATVLSISDVTVKSHVRRIFEKLGVRDRAEAIVYAFDHGVVEPRTSRPTFDESTG